MLLDLIATGFVFLIMLVYVACVYIVILGYFPMPVSYRIPKTYSEAPPDVKLYNK
jgi:hypothetical protein